ncbi:MAG: YARHG domain-containing protein [Acinetobacter populi]|uniref:YARHG domain-containing protein n=1 Tax=Acinetobacter populi TaxID=1582270 RepID=UPI0023579F81|nr:YARHG domain-containing protein [Acinetobacter populi]MCH4248199.1 YARHG domain-containing protein [Acinetobacter populi]
MAGLTSAYADDAKCKQLQDQKNLIYAAHGYCFKDPDAQKQYGADCHTKKPKFSDAESKRLAQIEDSQKSLNCPKKD